MSLRTQSDSNLQSFEAKPRGEITFAFPRWVVKGSRMTDKPQTLNCRQCSLWSISSLAGLASGRPKHNGALQSCYRPITQRQHRQQTGREASSVPGTMLNFGWRKKRRKGYRDERHRARGPGVGPKFFGGLSFKK